MNEINNMDQTEISRVLLVGVNIDDNPDFETAMGELESLAEACGMEVAAIIEQNLSTPNPAFYIGSGKVREVQEAVDQMDLDYVIFDETLSPLPAEKPAEGGGGAHYGQNQPDPGDFFPQGEDKGSQASGGIGQPAVYAAPSGRDEGSAGQAGRRQRSLSNKGTGEKQIELDRRKIEKRISELRRELEAIEHDRNTQRKRRNQSALPQVALVGYTNAGKSTLMNKMVETYVGKEEKMVMAKDMLFATLDTTVRKITQNDKKDFLLSDTVGFISKLPHGLVKAFRSTLDEVRYADLLLEVVDASDEHYREHMQVTAETLRELGAEKIPCIYVMNKADLVMQKGELPKVDGDKIFMSALDGCGLQELLRMIKERVFSGNREGSFLIPYEKGEIVGYFNDHATVISQEYLAEGVRLFVSCRESDYAKYKEYLILED